MSFSRSLRHAFRGQPSWNRPRRQPAIRRLSVELLEDRTLLSLASPAIVAPHAVTTATASLAIVAPHAVTTATTQPALAPDSQHRSPPAYTALNIATGSAGRFASWLPNRWFLQRPDRCLKARRSLLPLGAGNS